MRNIAELGGRKGRQLSEWDMVTSGFQDTPERRRATRDEFYNYTERDEPSRMHKCAERKQLNPNFAGALAGIGITAALLGDMFISGPSSVVVNYPHQAALGLTAGAAFFGGVTSSLVHGGNAAEKSAEQREKRLKWQAEFERQAGGKGMPEEMKRWQSRGSKVVASRNNNHERRRG